MTNQRREIGSNVKVYSCVPLCGAEPWPYTVFGRLLLMGLAVLSLVLLMIPAYNKGLDCGRKAGVIRAVLMGTKSCTKILILPKIFPTRFRFTFYG